MIEIPNALSSPDKVRELFVNGDWTKQSQRVVRDIPYTAEYWDSKICSSPEYKEAFNEILPVLTGHSAALGNKTKECRMLAYKMLPGDHFRMHVDGYLGRGFILYLCKEWEWDWGGLLMVAEGTSFKAYKPEYNNLIMFTEDDIKHFVTMIEPHATEPRYAMVGFMK